MNWDAATTNIFRFFLQKKKNKQVFSDYMGLIIWIRWSHYILPWIILNDRPFKSKSLLVVWSIVFLSPSTSCYWTIFHMLFPPRWCFYRRSLVSTHYQPPILCHIFVNWSYLYFFSDDFILTPILSYVTTHSSYHPHMCNTHRAFSTVKYCRLYDCLKKILKFKWHFSVANYPGSLISMSDMVVTICIIVL